MKLKARPDAIQKMIGDAVSHLPDAATAFYTLVTAKPAARPALLEELHRLEAEADERYVKLLRKVAKTFITPYDREDILRMIETLDDTIDTLDHAGFLVVGFKMGKLPDEFVKNAKELVFMCEQARDAVGLIKKPEKLEAVLFAVNRSENKLDDGYRKLLTDTLVDGADPIHAIRIKTLVDVVERASSSIEEFTHSLGVAAIKET